MSFYQKCNILVKTIGRKIRNGKTSADKKYNRNLPRNVEKS